MELIQSTGCLFQVRLDADYKTLLCAKGFTPTFTAKVKETTTEGDGTYQDYDYDVKTASIQLESVLVIQDNINPTSLDLFEFHRNMAEVPFRLLYFGQSGSVKSIEGFAIVEEINLPAAAGLLAEGSVKLTVKGEYTVADAIPQFVNLRIHIFNDPTAPAFLKFRLQDANGANVFQTDVLPQANGGNLANPLDITVQVPKGSWYYWFEFDTNNVNNVMTLDAPPTKSLGFNDKVTTDSSYPTQLYDFTADRTLEISLGTPTPPPTCVPPGIVGTPSLPDGQVSANYSYSFPITGSPNFTITNITKPSWMNITIFAYSVIGSPPTYSVLITGIPDTAGTGIDVSFDINNACGTKSFADSIDITTAPATQSTIDWVFESHTSQGVFRIYVNAVLAVEQLGNGTFTGSINVNAGATVEAQDLGANIVNPKKDLTIINQTDSITLFDVQDSFTDLVFDWVAGSSKNYTVAASRHS